MNEIEKNRRNPSRHRRATRLSISFVEQRSLIRMNESSFLIESRRAISPEHVFANCGAPKSHPFHLIAH